MGLTHGHCRGICPSTYRTGTRSFLREQFVIVQDICAPTVNRRRPILHVLQLVIEHITKVGIEAERAVLNTNSELGKDVTNWQGSGGLLYMCARKLIERKRAPK